MMPRARKEKSLTPEEKRAQTLVPENWQIMPLSELLISSKENTEDFTNPSVKYVGLEHIQSGQGIINFGSASELKSLKNVFHQGQILYGKLRPYLNKHGIAPFDGICSTDILVFDTTEKTIPEFANYLLDTSSFLGYTVANSKGINLPRISESAVLQYVTAIPPLHEQRRIVDRIERLFAALDAAKEKAQSVLAGCETRKAAILHKAFTGELIGLRNKSTVPFASIIDTIRIGPFGSALHKDDYIVGGIPLVNPKHISRQRITIDEHTSITPEKAAELDSYRLKTGDIVMGRRGEMGRSAPVTEKENGWLCGTGSLIIRLQKGYDASFYSQIIASHSSVQYLEENSVGSTMKNLNEKVVKSLPVPNFTQAEQKIIVSVLNKIMEKEQSVTAVTQSVLAQIDALKRSILARAFRGELGTGDPADPPAPLPE